MNFDKPRLELNKSIKKIDIKKVEKTELTPKPKPKPNDKPKNKIERSKIDIHKEPKNKIQREKIDLHSPARNKIEFPKIDINAPTKNKIEPQRIDPKMEPKHKLLPRKINPKASPRHKIEPRQTITYTKTKKSARNPIVLYFNNNKKFTQNEIEFLKNKDIKIENLKSRYSWVKNEKIAAQFYREVIHSQFKRVPTRRELHQHGFSGYMNAIRKNLGTNMTDLIKSAGFSPQFEFRFKYDGKNLSDLKIFYTRKVYPDLKSRHGLEGFRQPTFDHIKFSEYRGFTNALRKLGYSYNEFIKELGYKPNYELLYKNKSYSELRKIFKTHIIPNLNKKMRYKSEYKDAPSYEDVETYYRGFLNTLNRFNKSYLDFVKDLGLTPRQKFEAKLGVANHEALKFIISESMNHTNKKLNYYSEIKIFPKRNLQIDGLIINNINLSKSIKSRITNFSITETQASNLTKKIPKSDFLLFDFSNGYFHRNHVIRTELVARKIQKYQNLDKALLFLVGTRWPYQKMIKDLPKVINYRDSNFSTQNTLLVNPPFFSKLVGLEGDNLINFNNLILFNEKCDLENINKIIEESKEKDIKILDTLHFKNALKKRSLQRWI